MGGGGSWERQRNIGSEKPTRLDLGSLYHVCNVMRQRASQKCLSLELSERPRELKRVESSPRLLDATDH